VALSLVGVADSYDVLTHFLANYSACPVPLQHFSSGARSFAGASTFKIVFNRSYQVRKDSARLSCSVVNTNSKASRLSSHLASPI
jgi:hypothetical protein